MDFKKMLYTILSSDIVPLGKGGQSVVYPVNDSVVVKVYHHTDKSAKKIAINEYKVGTELFRNGISVPKMLGLIFPDFCLFRPFLQYPNTRIAIFMQRINGRRLHELEDDQQAEARRQYLQELKRVVDLGYYPYDVKIENALFDVGRWKIFLIDFSGWEKGNPEELNRLSKKLKEGRYY